MNGSAGPNEPRPTLFLVIDAIPFEVVHELWAAGEAPGFAEPRPMVSVFPSLTNVAVPALIRGAFERRPPGYEARYFHPPSGEIRGGFSDPEAESALEPYRTRPKGHIAHLAVYSMSEALAYGAVRWITRRFRQEGGPWLGYLAATDGIGHFHGRAALQKAARGIFEHIASARDLYEQEHGARPEVVLASDHGLYFGPLEHLDLKDVEQLLTSAGFVCGEPGPDGVILVPMGDTAGGVVHCAAGRASQVAEVLACAPGVDLVFGADGDGCVVYGAGAAEHARIEWRGARYRYVPESGDPLGYADVMATLGEWVDEEELFAATWDHRYPFALARVREGLTTLVEHPAPVLFSMADGWTFGPRLTYAAAQLRGGQIATHGGLSRAQSLGFAAATDARWPREGALRPDDVFRPWLHLVSNAGAIEAPASAAAILHER